MGLDIKVLSDTHEEIKIGEMIDDEDTPPIDVNIAGLEDAPPVAPGRVGGDFSEFDFEEEGDEEDNEDGEEGDEEFADFDDDSGDKGDE